MADAVLTETLGDVLLITLNRPNALNAVDSALAKSLVSAIDKLESQSTLGVGVITGAGKAFCAGMDLKAFATNGTPEGFQEFLERGSTKPLIAAVEGPCVAGGLEIALTCDLIVAAEGARFGIPEVSVGLFAAGGALMRLPRRVTYGAAMEMALTGELISADRALELGLVSSLVSSGAAIESAIQLAQRVTRNAPLAVSASKKLLQDSFGQSEEVFWRAQAPLLTSVFSSDDAREGALAFAEKRAPRWSGR